MHALRWALALALCVGIASAARAQQAEEAPAPAAAEEAPATSAEEAPAADNTWYTQRIDAGRVEHLWSKGGMFRAQTVIGGHPIVTLVSGRDYIALDLLSGKGISVQRHSNAARADESGARPFGDELQLLQAQGGERVGEDADWGGCVLHKLTNEGGRLEVCVSADENELPVYMERWERATNRTWRRNYRFWRPGINLGAQFFAPPAGAVLTRFAYADYVKAARDGTPEDVPVLYPALLHGTAPQ